MVIVVATRGTSGRNDNNDGGENENGGWAINGDGNSSL
jgi:hypothetical protein